MEDAFEKFLDLFFWSIGLLLAKVRQTFTLLNIFFFWAHSVYSAFKTKILSLWFHHSFIKKNILCCFKTLPWSVVL